MISAFPGLHAPGPVREDRRHPLKISCIISKLPFGTGIAY